MPRVLCDLENASHEISGVKFYPLEEGGLISDDLPQEKLEYFIGIPGYSVAEDDQQPEVKPEPAPPPTKRPGKKAEPVAAAQPAEPVEPENIF